MANIYYSFLKLPTKQSMGDILQTPGIFSESGTLVSSGTSAASASVIPAGTEVVEIWGDASFYLIFDGTPTAAKDSTSRPCAANVVYHVLSDGFVAGTDKIAVINI